MPLYEYLCSKCGEKFETIQKFADAPLTVHEACGGSVERLISRSGFSLKGSGWYATDYPRSGSKKDSDGDASKAKTDPKPADSKPGESKPAESKSSESKSSETKSDTKTETKPSNSSTKND